MRLELNQHKEILKNNPFVSKKHWMIRNFNITMSGVIDEQSRKRIIQLRQKINDSISELDEVIKNSPAFCYKIKLQYLHRCLFCLSNDNSIPDEEVYDDIVNFVNGPSITDYENLLDHLKKLIYTIMPIVEKTTNEIYRFHCEIFIEQFENLVKEKAELELENKIQPFGDYYKHNQYYLAIDCLDKFYNPRGDFLWDSTTKNYLSYYCPEFLEEYHLNRSTFYSTRRVILNNVNGSTIDFCETVEPQRTQVIQPFIDNEDFMRDTEKPVFLEEYETEENDSEPEENENEFEDEPEENENEFEDETEENHFEYQTKSKKTTKPQKNKPIKISKKPKENDAKKTANKPKKTRKPSEEYEIGYELDEYLIGDELEHYLESLISEEDDDDDKDDNPDKD